MTLVFDAARLGEVSVKLRESTVGLETATTNWAKEALAGLLTNGSTLSQICIVLHTAYGMKNMPSGKPVDKTKSAHLRYAADGRGGDNARKAMDAMEKLWADIDAADGAVRKLASDFILDVNGAPRKYWGFIKAAKAIITAHAEAGSEIELEPAEPETPSEPAPTASDANEGISLSDMANRLIVAIEAADDGAFEAGSERLTALMQAIVARTNAVVAAQNEALAA